MNIFEKTKKEMISFLESRGEYFRQVKSDQFRIRCPFCGDSVHNLNEGHLYLKINIDDNLPMVYHCFRCPDNESGIVNKRVLEALNAPSDLINDVIEMNKIVGKYDTKHIDDDYKLISFDYYIRDEYDKRKTDYINHRLGIDFSKEDYKNMGVITSLYQFLIDNHITLAAFNNSIMKQLEKNYVGFISSGNSHILFRDITGTSSIPWIKYPITKDSEKNKVFYSISKPIDIFTDDTININLSEGVMDSLGIAYHFNKYNSNNINIAICSKFYEPMILHMISLGLFGNNIILNIYSDNDDTFNRKKNNKTSVEFYKDKLGKFKPIFKEINIYHNIKDKDYGVPIDMIHIKKSKI